MHRRWLQKPALSPGSSDKTTPMLTNNNDNLDGTEAGSDFVRLLVSRGDICRGVGMAHHH